MRWLGSAALVSVVLTGAAPPWAQDANPGPVPGEGLEEPLSPLVTDDLERAAAHLRHHVPHLVARMPPAPEGHLSAIVVDGWGIVTGPNEVRSQAFLVKGAQEITVEGPNGSMPVELVALDVELRVARLRSPRPMSEIGLFPAPSSTPETREEDMDLFALVSTRPGAGVVSGALTDLGETPDLEGNLRSTLALAAGMPAFDARLRWVGLARAVAWDKDKAMLIPPELTRIRTTTTARSGPLPDATPERPWWAK